MCRNVETEGLSEEREKSYRKKRGLETRPYLFRHSGSIVLSFSSSRCQNLFRPKLRLHGTSDIGIASPRLVDEQPDCDEQGNGD